MTLSLRLHHRFPDMTVALGFEVPSYGITALFGPSGSGKSTVINVAAGLLRAQSCRLELDGTVLTDTERGVFVPPERRRVGLVFQDARLFPHMSVVTNLRFGQRRVGPGPVRFEDVVELLGLERLLDRRPHTLSGGERQRVGIGRALLAQPRLLLMDEPLASLDDARKAEIMPFIMRLASRLSLPVLYVTHALDEVGRLSDTLVLLEAGHLVACGPTEEVAARADLPLARRDDTGALLSGRVAENDPARLLTRIEAAGRAFLVPLLDMPAGHPVRLRIPAREVILARRRPDAISLHNMVDGEVRRIEDDPRRRSVLVEVGLPGGALLARVTPDAISRLDLAPGRPVLGLVKSTSIEVLGVMRPAAPA